MELVAGLRSVAGLVAPLAPALLHLVHEALAVGRARALGGGRRVWSPAGVSTAAHVLPGVDRHDRRGDHHDEAEHAQHRMHRDPDDQQTEAEEKADAAESRPTWVHPPRPGTPQRAD